MDENSAFVADDIDSVPRPHDLVESSSLHIAVMREDRAAPSLSLPTQPQFPAAHTLKQTKQAAQRGGYGTTSQKLSSVMTPNPPSASLHIPAHMNGMGDSLSSHGAKVELVSSPLQIIPDLVEEVHLGPTEVSSTSAAPSPAPVSSFSLRQAPLVPENRHVVKGAALPQPLRKSQLRAAPTGGSDSDTEDDAGNDNDAGNTNESTGGIDTAVDAEEQESEQQFVDEFGFVIDEDAKEKDEKFIRHIDGRQVVRREIKWANMAADWNRTNTKMHAKLKERCRKGIPSRFRGVAWQLLLGSFHQLNSDENAGVFIALRDKKLADKEVDAIISRDLARTFPNHVLFQDAGGAGQTFLRNVLHAYAGIDPEVGYVQGMGFVVAALSTQMGEEESFWALHEMMFNERYKMRELFRPGFPLLQQFFYQLKRLIARLLPKLSKRLCELDIHPSYYASQWFLTLFVAHFPFRALLRIWDVFFSEGWKIIFRTGIALMKWEESHLLSLPFEEMLPALKNLQDNKDARELLRRAHRIKFKTAELNRYGDEYWEKIGVIHRD
ncbi:putative disgorgin [Leptomonas seymouri]|uniref:Putative disgorgin n=1 Tax=Leptomonas seymouri TaxID=5684 RepID=A0A0N1PDX9_LEPSE|nr:putative disgorgin [Leptomonas seymouri]|eukprot:KPI90533.1 putative disgorgin [Leptomonas seymouri]